MPPDFCTQVEYSSISSSNAMETWNTATQEDSLRFTCDEKSCGVLCDDRIKQGRDDDTNRPPFPIGVSSEDSWRTMKISARWLLGIALMLVRGRRIDAFFGDLSSYSRIAGQMTTANVTLTLYVSPPSPFAHQHVGSASDCSWRRATILGGTCS